MRSTIALHDSLCTVRSCVCVIRRSSMRAVRVVCQWCVCVDRVLSEPVSAVVASGGAKGEVVILDRPTTVYHLQAVGLGRWSVRRSLGNDEVIDAGEMRPGEWGKYAMLMRVPVACAVCAPGSVR